jgi:hypothetical protein
MANATIRRAAQDAANQVAPLLEPSLADRFDEIAASAASLLR